MFPMCNLVVIRAIQVYRPRTEDGGKTLRQAQLTDAGKLMLRDSPVGCTHYSCCNSVSEVAGGFRPVADDHRSDFSCTAPSL